MEKIEAPKKERKFLKAIGNIGKLLAQELVMGIGRKFIGGIVDKIKLPKKRQGLMILLLLSCGMAFAQYPATGNKQRLGFQTTADGLVWRGSLSDTASIQPTSNQNAWVILDTVNFKFYSFDFTSNVWNQLPSGSTIDTTSLSNRIDLRVRYADTATMLQNYALKYYVDSIANNFQDSINDITNGYFKQQFTSVTSDTLLWTRSVQLPTDENLLLAFRNGQILNNNQYTRIDTNKIKIAANSYKVGENYTIVYVKGGGGSGGGGSSFDTTELNLQARLDLKLNISDTSQMLSNYATKAYADTSGRFYARQDFSNVSSSSLTWTQSDTLVPGGVNVIQVYRNGQILLPSQYTIPSSTSVVIAATSYKAGENYTVIFPRGGGAGSGGGSGSLTSISAGTGITVSPNPITTTGTVSADLSVLMELSDTVSLSNRINLKLNATDTASLSNRINSKLNISDTLSMLSPYFRDADTSLLNLTSRFALKLNATDTASLSNRINAKGTGTVTSVASGYGITGGTITSTGTLRLDSASVYNYIRDSIVDVQIGNDTIKILKQEYNNVTSDTLTWTITSKFPIQLRAYILLFRNGQLLINDQYSIIDTNKIKVAATSYKLGENYTVVTVSGIGSAGISQTGNPIYPEAGIALSTGTTWTTSIPNNSTNWNTAYNDKINSLAVTGTTTKTITLTQQDGGTVSGNFTDNGSVTSVDMTVPTGLSISGNPITTNGTLALSYASGYSLPTDANQNNWTIAYNDKIASLAFTGTSTKTLTLNQTDGGTVSNTFTDLQGVTGVTAGTGLTGGTITSTGTVAVDFGVVAPLANPTFTGTVSGITKNMVGLGNVDNTSDANKPVSTATQTALNLKFNTADTTSLNLTSRFATKLNLSDTLNMLVPYLRKADTTNMLLPYFRDADTTSLNLTSRFNTKQNTLSGTGFVKTSGTTISYDNSTYLRTGLADSTYQTILTNPLTGTGVSSFLSRFTGTSTLDSTRLYYSNGRFGVNMDASEAATHLTSRFVIRDFGHNFKFDGSAAGSGYTSTISHDDTGLKIGHSSNIRDIRFTLNGTSGLTIANNSNLPARAVGIANDTPTHQLDVTGTFRATGATTLGSTLAVTGATTLSTTTATPTSLLGKDGSNVVGEVTTVSQTGLMTRGETTATTGTPSAIFTVTHGLGSTPTSVLVTSAGLAGAEKIIFEVYAKNSTTFSVQAWNYDGTEASSKSVKIFWLAIK